MKTWFITGASSGLGRIMTEKLLARGDSVIATLRRPEALADLTDQYGAQLSIVALDVTDTPAIRAAIGQAFAAGRVDVIVSNAGYGLFGPAEELSDDAIERQIATNLIGSIQLIRAALAPLRAQGGGRIVQVSSEGGQIAYPGFSAYHATKWGIEGFVEAVRQEVAGFGIDFILAEPGPTRTNFGAALDLVEPSAVYAGTPVDIVLRAFTEGTFELRGDAGRTVDAMIAAADSDTPPLRLALGSTAFASIGHALDERAAALRGQRDVAYGADVD